MNDDDREVNAALADAIRTVDRETAIRLVSKLIAIEAKRLLVVTLQGRDAGAN